MKRILAVILAALLLLCSLAACGAPLSDDEARTAFAPLVERALSLDPVIFGDGLPVETSEFTLGKFFEATELTPDKAAYLPVAPDAAFRSEESLRAAILSVYSSDYGAYLCRLLFRGVSDGDEDETTLGLANVIFARYQTFTDVYRKEDSVLCVRTELDADKLALADVAYDYATLTVDRSGKTDGKTWVHVTVNATAASGEKSETVPVGLRFILEKDGWRLDSPAFVSTAIFDDPNN